MGQQDTKNETLLIGFEQHIEQLKEVYKQSDLKEKHKLNEHIKHLTKTYGEHDLEIIEKDLK